MSFGLANWNIRPASPQQQDSQFRSFINRNEESGSKFSLSRFRSSGLDKSQSKPAERRLTDSNFQTFSSGLRNEAVPTFETLERNIRGFSSSRAQDEFPVSRSRPATAKPINYSPKKLSGIKSKGAAESQRVSQTKTPTAKPEFKSILQKSGSGFLLESENRVLFPTQITRSRTLADVVPIQQLVDLRSKIESANQSQIGTLTPGYVNELVRLAQVITASVRKLR